MGSLRCISLAGLVLVGGACAVAGSSVAPVVDAPEKFDGPRSLVDAHAGDAPGGNLCASAATCTGAVSLGTVSGDTGGDMATATGFQSAWYSVRVTENDSGVFGVPQLLLTQLTSPSSEQYDVFVYVNTGTDVIECSSSSGTVMTNGATESVDLEWGETGTFSNDSDDSRSVSIEIRPKPGTCSAAKPWNLTVTGDT